jgi:hypothetical protein
MQSRKFLYYGGTAAVIRLFAAEAAFGRAFKNVRTKEDAGAAANIAAIDYSIAAIQCSS